MITRHGNLARRIAAAVLLCANMPAHAEDVTNDWHFRSTLYGYLSSLKGDASFPAGAATIKVSAGDVLNHTDAAFMGVFEARKGAVGGFVDAIAINLGGSKAGVRGISFGGGLQFPPGITADTALGVRMRAVTLAAEYRLQETSQSSLDIFAGARMLETTTTLNYAFSADLGPFVGPARRGARKSSFADWDAVAGVKGRYSLGAERQWFLLAYADAGSGDSNLTWQGLFGGGRSFGKVDVTAGWRHVAYNFSADSKIRSLVFDGPALGASVFW